MILDPQGLNRTWDWAGVGTDLTSHGESDAPPQRPSADARELRKVVRELDQRLLDAAGATAGVASLG
jgi:hypothetical protein